MIIRSGWYCKFSSASSSFRKLGNLESQYLVCKTPHRINQKRGVSHIVQNCTDIGPLICYDAENLEELGGIVSRHVAVGDVILLTGDVGAGKTCFARGFIRTLTGKNNLMVTSPTFLLDLSYDCMVPTVAQISKSSNIDRGLSSHDIDDGSGSTIDSSKIATAVHHMDLYRINSSPDDSMTRSGSSMDCQCEQNTGKASRATASALGRLGIPGMFANNVTLIEWPQLLFRASSSHETSVPDSYLSISITVDDCVASDDDGIGDDNIDGDDVTEYRRVRIKPHGKRWLGMRTHDLQVDIDKRLRTTVQELLR